jgi:YVTN family beta-propeller protein
VGWPTPFAERPIFPPMADVSIGSVFAGYRIESVAGEGGMGRVYRATQMALNRRVALKLIVPALADDAEFRVRFERESELTASIEHPNVIPVYEAGEAEGRLFIAMRWVEGTDVRSVILSEGRLEPSRVVAIVEQVAAALDAAHRGGLVHRDVKPANVMLTATHGQEHVYLTDFGLTKKTASATALTRTGHFVGTPDYMSPEQIKGERADARADVYALGCVLFHALTGRTPYERDSEVAKMYAHLNDPPPSAVETVPGTPVGLDAVITRALAKDADQRYPSAGDLGRASRAVLTGAAPSQPERSLATGLAAPRAPETAPTAPAPGAAATAPAGAATAPAAAPAPAATAPAGAATAPAAAPTAPAPTAPAPSPPAAPRATSQAPPRERPRRRAVPIAMAALLVLGATGGVLAAAGVFSGASKNESASAGDGSITFGDPARSTRPKAVVTTDPRAERAISVGAGADGVAVGAGMVWIANKHRNEVIRLDPDTRRLAGRTSVGLEPDSLAIGADSIWVTNTSSDSVSRIDLRTAKVTRTIPVGNEPEGIVASAGRIWVANGADGTVTRINPTGSKPGPPVQVGAGPVQLAEAGDKTWVTTTEDDAVVALDSRTGNKVGSVPVAGSPRGIAFADGLLWVSASKADKIVAIDPATREVVKQIAVADDPREVRAGEGAVWATNAGAGVVTVIDPKARRVVKRVKVEGKPYGMAVGEGRCWAASLAEGLITPIKPR